MQKNEDLFKIKHVPQMIKHFHFLVIKQGIIGFNTLSRPLIG